MGLILASLVVGWIHAGWSDPAKPAVKPQPTHYVFIPDAFEEKKTVKEETMTTGPNWKEIASNPAPPDNRPTGWHSVTLPNGMVQRKWGSVVNGFFYDDPNPVQSAAACANGTCPPKPRSIFRGRRR